MDLTAQIDGYCERLDPSYWAEPINALTNAAFLIAAVLMWYRIGRARLPLARGLIAMLAAIGVGSFLFHTHATGWAALTDVLPILGFILLYIFAINRDVLEMRLWLALLATAAFVPYAILVYPVFVGLGMGSSAAYAPVPLLIALYAFWPVRIYPDLAQRFFVGAGLLCLSLAARMADLPLCERLPLGTHFLWHILNAIMLGWMINAYARHMIAYHRRGIDARAPLEARPARR